MGSTDNPAAAKAAATLDANRTAAGTAPAAAPGASRPPFGHADPGPFGGGTSMPDPAPTAGPARPTAGDMAADPGGRAAPARPASPPPTAQTTRTSAARTARTTTPPTPETPADDTSAELWARIQNSKQERRRAEDADRREREQRRAQAARKAAARRPSPPAPAAEVDAETYQGNRRTADFIRTRGDVGDLPIYTADAIRTQGERAIREVADLIRQTRARAPDRARQLLARTQTGIGADDARRLDDVLGRSGRDPDADAWGISRRRVATIAPADENADAQADDVTDAALLADPEYPSTGNFASDQPATGLIAARIVTEGFVHVTKAIDPKPNLPRL